MRESGLTAQVLASENTAAGVERELLEYIQQYVPKNEGYLAGNSVHFDKEFMKYEFPRVIEYLCYRIIGLSSARLPYLCFPSVLSTFCFSYLRAWIADRRCLEHQDLFKDVGARTEEWHAAKEI